MNYTRSGTVECLVCGELIELFDVMENEIIECEMCSTEFEILDLDSLTLEELDDDEEDYGE